MLGDKNCKNCKYYVEHYVIIPSQQLLPIGGHCQNKPQKKTPLEITDDCGYWESNEAIISARQKTITDYLRDTEKRLQQMHLILNSIDT